MLHQPSVWWIKTRKRQRDTPSAKWFGRRISWRSVPTRWPRRRVAACWIRADRRWMPPLPCSGCCLWSSRSRRVWAAVVLQLPTMRDPGWSRPTMGARRHRHRPRPIASCRPASPCPSIRQCTVVYRLVCRVWWPCFGRCTAIRGVCRGRPCSSRPSIWRNRGFRYRRVCIPWWRRTST